jgi:glutamate-1-semialdehyde 2,1-aminomutase
LLPFSPSPQADLVIYGKTLGGGLPIGVVCGPSHLMARTDPKSPLRVAYVVGTFAAHPVVMSTMRQFLDFIEAPATPQLYDDVHARVGAWVGATNAALEREELPLRVASYGSVWTMLFCNPGRYHWMLQYYLRDEGVHLSWVGTGRLNFALDWTQEHFDELQAKLLAACRRMRDDGWWWHDPRGNGLIQLQLASELICASAQHITLWWWKAVFERMYRWSSMITRTI